MKILQIVSSSRISGAEKHVMLLSNRLLRRGHQVLTVCPPGGWLPEQLSSASVPTWELGLRGAEGVRSFRAMLDYIRKERVDIIHSHLTSATYFGCILGRMTQTPLVSSLHTRTSDLVYRRLMPKRDNRIITVSNYLREMLIKQGIPGWLLKTIYNGTEFFPEESEIDGFEDLPSPAQSTPALSLNAASLPVRAELNLPPDAELIGLFGHVDEQKGHPLLIQAARSIVERRPKAYIVFIGHAEPRIQKNLWEMAAADGVAQRLRYMGVRNDVPRLMDAMDIVTVPSQIESFGMVIIEAMARCKPVVAARVGGIPELVIHEETGLLVDRHPAQLADALVSLLRDPQKRESMGRKGRERARTRFSADLMVSNIESLYREMAQRKYKD